METNTSTQIISCDDLSSDSHEELDDEETSPPLNPIAEELLKRCITLSDEISLLEKKLLQRLPPKQRSKKGNLPIELRHFKNAIQVEQRSLEALSYKPPTDEKVLHSLRSSNLRFLESVWSVAKTCTGLQVIFRTVYLFDYPSDDVPKLRGKEKKQLKRKKMPVQVDIIAQNGMEWIKVANISQKRVETEFAKAKWEAEGFRDDDESGDEDGNDGYSHSNNGDDDRISGIPKGNKEDHDKMVSEFQRDSDVFSLVKSARSMVQAAQQTRVQYLHPEITIILPNIAYDAENADTSSPVHNLVTAILSTGARVQTSNTKIIPSTDPPDGVNGDKDNQKSITTTDQNGNNIEAVIHDLSCSADPINLITPTIILDCTLLLALVSDLSHEDVVEQPIFHRYILQQVRSEREEPLLPHWVYPSIQGRQMVCTFEAYKRFREIVEIVGSEREKKRAEVLVDGGTRDWKHPSGRKGSSSGGGSSNKNTASSQPLIPPPPNEKTRQDLCSTLQSLSRHTVPSTLQLPITVIDCFDTQLMSHNPVAAKIGPELSSVNRSSLFAAWELGWTIVTTNGSVVKRLEWLVEENRMKDDDVGPKVYCLAIARSLVGKMKRGTEILKGE
ncbi:hypothetical protein ABW20_dc0109852 [Dactylellina cionopaga]|nr:hypothetical protein ABW20_dc0109852 [Dactylellina cionopaga]